MIPSLHVRLAGGRDAPVPSLYAGLPDPGLPWLLPTRLLSTVTPRPTPPSAFLDERRAQTANSGRLHRLAVLPPACHRHTGPGSGLRLFGVPGLPLTAGAGVRCLSCLPCRTVRAEHPVCRFSLRAEGSMTSRTAPRRRPAPAAPWGSSCRRRRRRRRRRTPPVAPPPQDPARGAARGGAGGAGWERR